MQEWALTALAALPLAAVIVALLLRASSLIAAVVGAGAAVIVGALWFRLTPAVAGAAVAQWWPLVVEVLLIVGGGIAFAEFGRRSGAQEVISGWLRRALGAGVAPVLAIVHGVTPLAESLTGFGIGAILAVPLLVGLGLDGRRAATIGLLGLCVVPWGSMGPGTLIAAEFGGVGFAALGVASAVVSLPVFVGVGVAAALLVSERGTRLRASLAAIGSGVVLWGGVLGANLVFGTAPAGAVGALVTLTVHLVIRRVRGGRVEWPAAMRRATVSYIVLLGGVVAASICVRLADAGDTAWRAVASPALWLLVASIVAARGAIGQQRPALVASTRTWVRVGPATGLFIVLGIVMSISGMSAHLADALTGAGRGYLLALPLLAGLGGFITGSNSGANAMFAATQAEAAAAIGAATLPALAVHNVSASLLTMAFPARVELAARLCPEPPTTGPILRTLLLVDGVILALFAVLLFAFA